MQEIPFKLNLETYAEVARLRVLCAPASIPRTLFCVLTNLFLPMEIGAGQRVNEQSFLLLHSIGLSSQVIVIDSELVLLFYGAPLDQQSIKRSARREKLTILCIDCHKFSFCA